MLRMENVSKSYQHRGGLVTALDQAQVHIPRGDFVALVGPSGSGKTAAVKELARLIAFGECPELNGIRIYEVSGSDPGAA